MRFKLAGSLSVNQSSFDDRSILTSASDFVFFFFFFLETTSCRVTVSINFDARGKINAALTAVKRETETATLLSGALRQIKSSDGRILRVIER